MGTRIQGLQVTKAVDGDTIKVRLNDKDESLRLTCVDTEESLPGSDKPVTEAGKAASEMAKTYFESGSDLAVVDIEFDTDDPVQDCLVKHRDNFGRLLCFVHKGGDNYNLKLVREGWSPYFVKYGRARIYHDEFMAAEAQAQANNLVIWDPIYNGGGPSRDYSDLVPWWSMRGLVVEDYRRLAQPNDVLCVRLDYQKLLDVMGTNQTVTILCDLQAGVNRWTGDGAVIYAGSVHHKFNLWIADTRSEDAAPLIRLIEKRYAGMGRGYVYVTGEVSDYRGRPQMELTTRDQLSDNPSVGGRLEPTERRLA